VVYVISAILLVLFAAWVSSYLERRDKQRLERIVEVRTNELRETNDRLRSQASELRMSEERYRKLSRDLELRVDERTSELHGTNERLVASNRELEAFSYSVSHDLRAPLRNIRGFADLLHRRNAGGLDKEAKRFLDIVASEASRLAELIDSLLGFSRLNRTDLSHAEVDMKSLIETVRDEYRSEVAGRTIDWQIGEFPTIRGDLTLLRQVVSNLVGNALKFTRDRERAEIEFGATRDDDAGEVVFFVRDNGVGFDQKYAGKLFGVFERLHTDARYEGTGIGLANVKRIITRHGGRVWAEGTPGEGATFFFTIGASEQFPGA
jgi:light-regulated signal transduction histidine kinase (bacteriophytochrome)